jgi:hypothetical protein
MQVKVAHQVAHQTPEPIPDSFQARQSRAATLQEILKPLRLRVCVALKETA